MAFFGVTIEKIASVKKHPNADRLDLATLKGIDFQFITAKDMYKKGDQVLYFPIDSLLPEELQEKLGLLGKLSGSKKNRVKTIRLRGEISQGLVGPLSLIEDMPKGEDITEFLGVTKYEPPEPGFSFGGGKRGKRPASLPEGQSVYDIEGCERNAGAVVEIALNSVAIFEKLEGSNWSATCNRTESGGMNLSVNTRRHAIPLDEEDTKGITCTKTGALTDRHAFWTAYFAQGLDDLMQKVMEKYPDAKQIILYGEFCGPGVQGNIYKLDDYKVFLFDIKVDNKYLNPAEFLALTKGYNTVPLLALDVDLVDWLAEQLKDYKVPEWTEDDRPTLGIKEASNGKSALHDTLREGVVFKPMTEQYSEELHGRLVLKQRSPEYLAGSDN
jgi:RNA ligase (TIGR02306 family)